MAAPTAAQPQLLVGVPEASLLPIRKERVPMKSYDEKSIDEKPITKNQAQRKPYHSPQLLIYGHIREITRSLGTNSGADALSKTGL